MTMTTTTATTAGRITLVTGAARGIGRQIATAFARSGHHVVIGDLPAAADTARAVADGLTGEGLSAGTVDLDVTDEDSVAAAVGRITETVGAPQVLVNNAGISRPAPTLETSLAQWNEVVAVNLTGQFLCARACLPAMRDAGWGRIIGISSFNAKSAPVNGDNASYAASKAGITGLTHNLAVEFGRDGITVNAIAPGIVDTELLRRAHPPQRLAELVDRLPTGRFTLPEEIAATAVFLAGDVAASITGEIVNVNGGLYFD
ncbi:SDR family NAD(P)-dependent oxidoreductase [Actinoallomurus iriomotensis]|uniref:Beta-ketoacyl-ACP reductase n=1 Tax=Actinoallomurus iriomotensis TaxID=478107 RepID=A0A9W6S3N6_9ACTN|nr:SDR family NAD(P)-dependent oxidoreductase [Actinoallomurus iriomotensis]GLY87986.1 beta-ketoacyl-ACP reductase [Actinoallomurus iriomotensis]